MSKKISENKNFKEAMRTVVFFFVMVVLIFGVAAITKLKESSSDTSSDTIITTATTSFIDNIIPTTKTKTDILEEINKIFTLYNPPEEEIITKYTFNRYMKDFSYEYNDLTRAYSYDNLFIIKYDDLSGIIKLFIFNKKEYTHIKTLKTVKPISENYTNVFIIESDRLFFLNIDTSRDDDNCLVFKKGTIDYFDILDHEVTTYKEIEFNDSQKITC